MASSFPGRAAWGLLCLELLVCCTTATAPDPHAAERLVELYGPEKAYEVADIHSTASVLHAIREQMHYSTVGTSGELRPYNWSTVAHDIAEGGHRFCALLKDIWACSGETYVKILRRTKPFDSEAFGLDTLPRGARVLVEGSSFFGEVVSTIACGSDARVWKVGNNFSNSLVVASRSRQRDVVMWLISNDGHTPNADAIVPFVVRANFQPSHIVLGQTLTGRKQMAMQERFRVFTKAFPANKTRYSLMNYNPLPADCRAKGPSYMDDCATGEGHQCLPGPMVRVAEKFVALFKGQWAAEDVIDEQTQTKDFLLGPTSKWRYLGKPPQATDTSQHKSKHKSTQEAASTTEARSRGKGNFKPPQATTNSH